MCIFGSMEPNDRINYTRINTGEPHKDFSDGYEGVLEMLEEVEASLRVERREIHGEIEVILNETLGEHVMIPALMVDMAARAVWQEDMKGTRTLIVDGRPVVEMLPLEVNTEGEKVTFVQKYRKFTYPPGGVRWK